MNDIKAGTTSKLDCVYITNLSTGAPITGATFSGVTISYFLSNGSTVTHASAVTATLGTWVTLGFKEVDATNFPGLYQIGIPNAALATAGTFAFISITGVASQAPAVIKYAIVAYDPTDAVRLGLTALPNVAIGTSGQIATGDATGKPLGVAGNVTGSVASVTGAVASVTGNVGGSVASVTAGVTVTTNNDKTGYALTTAPPTGAAIAALILASPTHPIATDTNGYVTATNGGGGSAPTVAQIAAAILDNPNTPLQTDGAGHVNAAVVLGAVGAVAGNVGGSVAGTVNAVNSPVTIDTTQAVPRDSAPDTVGYHLHAAGVAGFGNLVIDTGGLTETLYEPADGTTPARVWSIDNSTAPTRRTA